MSTQSGGINPATVVLCLSSRARSYGIQSGLKVYQDASRERRKRAQFRRPGLAQKPVFLGGLEHAFAKETGRTPSAPVIAAPPSLRLPEHVPFDAGGG